MKNKLRYGVPFSIVAGALMLVSVAWACTTPNGSTFITTPTCDSVCEARRGTDIMVHARFMSPTQSLNNYELYLSIQPWCHNDSRNIVLASDLVVDSTVGGIPDTFGEIPGSAAGYTDQDLKLDGDNTLHDDVRATIPSTASRRNYDVCFNNGQGVDLNESSNSSSPVVLTVK